MKKFFKTAAMPMAVFAIAIGSAFATNAMKNEQIAEDSYQKMDSQGVVCIKKVASCDINGATVCTWSDGIIDHQLYGKEFNPKLNETVCTRLLYKTE